MSHSILYLKNQMLTPIHKNYEESLDWLRLWYMNSQLVIWFVHLPVNQVVQIQLLQKICMYLR